MTPGPTQVPEAAGWRWREVMHHRSPEFKAIMVEVLDGIKYVLQTQGDVMVLTASGSGGMEAAVTSTVPRGGKAIVLEGGVFAALDSDLPGVWHRGRAARNSLGLGGRPGRREPVVGRASRRGGGLRHAVGKLDRRRARHRSDRPARKGNAHAVGGRRHQRPGSTPCYMDRWNIDVMVVGSQKALMLPPGLVIVAVSQKGWRQIDSIEPQAFYFNLKHYRQMLPETPWTPAITLVVGLAENLREFGPSASTRFGLAARCSPMPRGQGWRRSA